MAATMVVRQELVVVSWTSLPCYTFPAGCALCSALFRAPFPFPPSPQPTAVPATSTLTIHHTSRRHRHRGSTLLLPHTSPCHRSLAAVKPILASLLFPATTLQCRNRHASPHHWPTPAPTHPPTLYAHLSLSRSLSPPSPPHLARTRAHIAAQGISR
jgi:hypothetical protein